MHRKQGEGGMTAPQDATAQETVTADGRIIGGTVMEMRNITLRFGGVVAIQDITFDIRQGEIRAIIGPNGAGKSSMLNVINGFYHPQEGEIWYKGEKRPSMEPYEIAKTGIAWLATKRGKSHILAGLNKNIVRAPMMPNNVPNIIPRIISNKVILK